MVIANLVAILALALTALAEFLHARRIRRVARLAFGPGGRPAAWVSAVPVLRCLAVAAAAWGATVLLLHDPIEVDVEPSAKASMQLVVCLDVSPSMQIKDAGSEAATVGGEKVSRAAWAGTIVQGILDRLDMKSTRISVIAFYTKALPVIQQTFDKNVIANVLDGLPMYVAFEPGSTDINLGVNAALEMARPWARRSATLLVVSDGDVDHAPAPAARPDSIADVIVIGVGDPNRGSLVGGHNSRQDAAGLRQLAARLGGIYHDGNQRHLPSEVVERLTMISPRVSDAIGLREAGLVALGFGCSACALLTPALMLAGRRRAFGTAPRTGPPVAAAPRTVPEGTGPRRSVPRRTGAPGAAPTRNPAPAASFSRPS